MCVSQTRLLIRSDEKASALHSRRLIIVQTDLKNASAVVGMVGPVSFDFVSLNIHSCLALHAMTLFKKSGCTETRVSRILKVEWWNSTEIKLFQKIENNTTWKWKIESLKIASHENWKLRENTHQKMLKSWKVEKSEVKSWEVEQLRRLQLKGS